MKKDVRHRPLILVGAVAFIVDERGKIFLQQRKYPPGVRGILGGIMELGESTEDTARREIYEETGLKIGKLQLINVYSGSQHYIKAENGDEFYAVTVAYYTKGYEGVWKIDKSESIRFDFFYPDQLPTNIVKTY